MTLIEQIKRDREAGTPGPWGRRPHWADDDGREVFPRADEKPPFGEWTAIATVTAHDDTDYGEKAEANARRIARVPQLEAALLAAEELAKVTGSLIDLERPETPAMQALTAFRKACEATQ